MREKNNYNPSSILCKITYAFKVSQKNKNNFNPTFAISKNEITETVDNLFNELIFYTKREMDPHRKTYEKTIDFRLNNIIFPLLEINPCNAKDTYLKIRNSSSYKIDLKNRIADKFKYIKDINFSFINYSDVFKPGDIINYDNHSCKIIKICDDNKIRIQDTLYGTNMNIKRSEIVLANPEFILLRQPNCVLGKNADEKFALSHTDFLFEELYSYLDHRYSYERNVAKEIMRSRFNKILLKIFELEGKSINWIYNSLNSSEMGEYYKNICLNKLNRLSSNLTDKNFSSFFKANDTVKYNGHYYEIFRIENNNSAILKSPFNFRDIKVSFHELLTSNLEHAALNIV